MDDSGRRTDGGAGEPAVAGPLAVSLIEVLEAPRALAGELRRQAIAARPTPLGEACERLALLWLPAGLTESALADLQRRVVAGGARLVIGCVPHGCGADAERALAAGLDDVMSGRASGRELAGRLQALERRRAVGRAADDPMRFGSIAIDRRQHQVWIEGRPVSLTPIEVQLMAALVSARGRFRTRQDLLEAAWGDAGLERGDRAVDNVLLRLRRKLPDPGVIETVRGVGFRLRG